MKKLSFYNRDFTWSIILISSTDSMHQYFYNLRLFLQFLRHLRLRNYTDRNIDASSSHDHYHCHKVILMILENKKI